MPTDNTPEATEVAAPETDSFTAFTEAADEVTETNPKYTAEDIAKARAQEKDKLYPTIDKMKEELSILRKREEERAAQEADRIAARKQREAERAAEKKAQEEEEMSFKELLKAKEEEWQSKLEEERQEREKAFALLEREREFQEIDRYRSSRIEQERENIIPELIDMVAGNSRDEIEQSILSLKDRSAKIFESVQAASQQNRKEMVGTKITVPASGPLDNNSDSFSLTPEAIKNMTAKEYAEKRSKILGAASANNRGQGLFG